MNQTRIAEAMAAYRMVMLRKHVAVTKGQQKLFDYSPYFLYITNITLLPNAERNEWEEL